MSNITTASNEYARRPADECFPDVASMVTAAREDKRLSRERSYNWRDLTWRADGDKGLVLASAAGTADLTHWSFGQGARALGAPAGFLRDDLSPAIAADVLNYRIMQQPHGTAPVVLVRAPNGKPRPVIRAITSDSYARVWDADYFGDIQDRLGHKWAPPPTWDPSQPQKGVYRGDRDAFVLWCEGGSIVDDPSLASSGTGQMYRGLMARNSEVGASAIVLECIYYRYVCGNHILWGAVVDKRFRRRHVGANALRDTMREINTIAKQWTERSAHQDQQIIRGLIDRQIADTREGVIDELQAIGFTRTDAIAAYDSCEQHDKASPRSYWGIAQGATRISQQSGYQDERYALDKLAAAVLARGSRQLVAA